METEYGDQAAQGASNFNTDRPNNQQGQDNSKTGESRDQGQIMPDHENEEQNHNIATSWQADNQENVPNNSQEGENLEQNQNIGQAWRSNSPTEQQPSASQNNDWEQNNSPGQATGPKDSSLGEDNIQPRQELRAGEDDELGEEMPEDYRREDFIEENDLERTDQDYRDGDNQSGEDQDDEDALRDGK